MKRCGVCDIRLGKTHALNCHVCSMWAQSLFAKFERLAVLKQIHDRLHSTTICVIAEEV